MGPFHKMATKIRLFSPLRAEQFGTYAMKIDRRVTNGLAWAGAFLVVGVPTADMLSAQFLGGPAQPSVQVATIAAPVAPVPAPLSQRPAAPAAKPAPAEVAAVAPAARPVPAPAAKPAPVAAEIAVTAAPKPPAQPSKPAATPAAQTADVVDAYLQSGKKLPSYITDDSALTAPAQVAATPSARPTITTAPAVAPPVETDPIQVAAIPPKVAPTPMPLSMRPTPITVPVAAVAPGQDLIVLPPDVDAPRPPADVTAADLADWESGPLSEFLAERQQGNVDAYYESDGFFLDQGPNRQRPRRDRVVAPVDDFVWFVD